MKFTKLTPNLVVHDVQAAVCFYQSVLGFQPAITVPDNTLASIYWSQDKASSIPVSAAEKVADFNCGSCSESRGGHR
jgi:hypothetical protein